MSNIIDSIRMSGTTYAISDSGGTKVVEITQNDYDNLPTSAKTANIMYVITDAEPFDVSNYYTKAETSGATELATAFAATQPKLSAGTNITIDANNVISAEGGGGKAISAGTNISVTSGETADTINCTLPITAGTGSNSIMHGSGLQAGGMYSHAEGEMTRAVGKASHAEGGGYNYANGNYSHSEGYMTKTEGGWSHAEGWGSTANTECSHAEGNYVITNNKFEHSQGSYNVSSSESTIFGDSGNTLFSVGNGTSNSARHNAFEIRQNGDIYITKDGSDVKLQDQLGGGGGGIDSGTVQTMIDQSISGKTNQTDFVSHSGNTSIHVTTAQTAAWNAKSDFSGSYNDLTDKPTLFSGSYNDLTDKPTIPSKTSDLTNDSNFATSAYVDTKLSISDFNTYSGTVNTAIGNKANSSDVYTKSQTSGATEISTALNAKLDTTAYTPCDLSNYYQKSETSGATEIATAINAVSGAVPTTYVSNVRSDSLGSGVRFFQWEKNSNGSKSYTTIWNFKINNNSVLTSSYNGDAINYNLVETSAFTAHTADTTIHVTTAQTAAWDAKSDFSGSYNDLTNKLSAGTNITIVDNVISATSGGGGKAVSGGRYITVTSGETADTVSFNLEIGNLNNKNHSLALNGWIYGTGSTSNSNTESGKVYGTVFLGGYNKNDGYNGGSSEVENMFIGSNNQIKNTYGSNSDYNLGYNVVIGQHNNITGYKLQNSVAIGFYNSGTTSYQLTCGYYNKTSNVRETSFGSYNNSVSASTTFGNSGNTLFSVGNGTSSARHNALEIRQNGDIYVPNTDDTSTANWYQKPMVRLQDTITALGGLKLVKLTQSEYDNLSTKDNSTLYVIVN